MPGMFREWLGSAVRDEARHFDFPQRATAIIKLTRHTLSPIFRA